jgi:hypothetical protein
MRVPRKTRVDDGLSGRRFNLRRLQRGGREVEIGARKELRPGGSRRDDRLLRGGARGERQTNERANQNQT